MGGMTCYGRGHRYLISPDGKYSLVDGQLEPVMESVAELVSNVRMDEDEVISTLISQGWMYAIDRTPQPMFNPSWVIRGDQYTRAMVQKQVVPFFSEVICSLSAPDEKVSWCDSIGDCQWLRIKETDIERLSAHFTMRPYSSAMPSSINMDVIERMGRVHGPLFQPSCDNDMLETLAIFWHLVDEFHFNGVRGVTPWHNDIGPSDSPAIHNADYERVTRSSLSTGGWRYDFVLRRPEGRIVTVHCHEREAAKVVAGLESIGVFVGRSNRGEGDSGRWLDTILGKMHDGGIVVAEGLRFEAVGDIPAGLDQEIHALPIVIPRQACCLGSLYVFGDTPASRQLVWKLGARW